jgi:hypothetical protein
LLPEIQYRCIPTLSCRTKTHNSPYPIARKDKNKRGKKTNKKAKKESKEE